MSASTKNEIWSVNGRILGSIKALKFQLRLRERADPGTWSPSRCLGLVCVSLSDLELEGWDLWDVEALRPWWFPLAGFVLGSFCQDSALDSIASLNQQQGLLAWVQCMSARFPACSLPESTKISNHWYAYNNGYWTPPKPRQKVTVGVGAAFKFYLIAMCNKSIVRSSHTT